MPDFVMGIETGESKYKFAIQNIPCKTLKGGVAIALKELNKWDQALLSNWKDFRLKY